MIATFQNIVDAFWYIRNADLHRDLNIPIVKEKIKRMAEKQLG